MLNTCWLDFPKSWLNIPNDIGCWTSIWNTWESAIGSLTFGQEPFESNGHLCLWLSGKARIGEHSIEFDIEMASNNIHVELQVWQGRRAWEEAQDLEREVS
jgi:hypothetical protein